MKCEKTKEYIIDFFYDEIPEEERINFESHLKECKKCREELAELKKTSKAMKMWKIPEPNMNLEFTSERGTFFDKIKDLAGLFSTFIKKPAYVFTVSLMAVFLVLSFSNFKASYNPDTGSFSISTSIFGSSSDPVNEGVINQQLEIIQQKLLERLNLILTDYDNFNRDRTERIVMNAMNELQIQRERDFATFGSSLVSLQETTGEKFDNTLAFVLGLMEQSGAIEIKK
ncbi:anti-sigma factor family protein [candidate division KSB1 bacterium]